MAIKYLVHFKWKPGLAKPGFEHGWIDGYRTATKAKEAIAKVESAGEMAPWTAEYLGNQRKYYARKGKGL